MWVWVGLTLSRAETGRLALLVASVFALIAAFFAFVVVFGVVEQASGGVFHDFAQVVGEAAVYGLVSGAIAIWSLRLWRRERRSGPPRAPDTALPAVRADG